MKISTAYALALVGLLVLVRDGLTPAEAQTSGQTSSDCEATPAPTPPAQGVHSGTQPGGAGSTAWSGGTGGSHIGTTPGSPTPASPNEHPPVVEGKDPSVVGPTRKDC